MPTADKNKLHLKDKLKAWWDGYDPNEIEKKLKARSGNEKEEAPKLVVEEEPEPLPLVDAAGWGEQRINICQYIWGEGFCGPGGSEQIISMTKLLALDKKMSMLDIGSTLGGKARALAENYGVWVTGLETSEQLTKAGNEISLKKGLSKKVNIIHTDYKEEQTFERNFDRVFSKEALFTVEDKEKLLRGVYTATKPEGLALFTDYVLGSEGVVMKDDFINWRNQEPLKPYCKTEKEYKDVIELVGFQTRVNEDISQQYIELISNAWRGSTDVVKELLKEENSTEMIDILLTEAEFWARRVTLLKSGYLKVWRILAYKPDTRSRMMSDW
jgi:cyclopropane fatty-acyl-phospholipid synthase-like methyltransferase